MVAPTKDSPVPQAGEREFSVQPGTMVILKIREGDKTRNLILNDVDAVAMVPISRQPLGFVTLPAKELPTAG